MKARKRDLVGRKIAAVDFRRFYDHERRAWCSDPVLVLDNGRRVWFVTEETHIGKYGTEICITDPKGRK